MPVQTPQWCDLLCCCICYNAFDGVHYQPISLVCGHTACRSCLLKLQTKQCPFDQSAINIPVTDLPQNEPILKILESHHPGAAAESDRLSKLLEENDLKEYRAAVDVLGSLSSYLRRAQSERGGSVWSPQLSRPMQRKLVTLLCCQLVEQEGRGRALKCVRSLGERSLMELLLLHQNPYHLSSNLWAAVRGRGCQFLGPAMQEEVLRLVLLALSEGALISRKVLVMYIVQTLEKDYPQASKTSVGHVVQLLYRASCFNVIKRDGESSLMQLKEEFRTYEALRREHDAQIVQIAQEAGLRISPDQWSALLYGDQGHKSHMQSIIDRLQTPQSFVQNIQELMIGLQRTGDPAGLIDLKHHYESLADIDSSRGETVVPSWNILLDALFSAKAVLEGQIRFSERYGGNRVQRETVDRSVVAYKFKTSMCRDIGESKTCSRGESCTFAHSLEEMERYRARSRLMGYRSNAAKHRSGGASGNGDAGDKERSDEFDFGFEDGEIPDEGKHGNPPPVAGPMLHNQMPAVRQSPRHTQTAQGPVFPPPTALPTPMEDATTTNSVVMTTPPLHMGPGSANMMMQWQPSTAIVNTPSGPVAMGSAQPVSFPIGPTVRYQLVRHRGATCSPGPSPQCLPPPPSMHVAATPPEYGYYWYPPTANIQTRTNIYQPGDVVHVEMPMARMVPAHHAALAGGLTTACGGIATAVAGGHYATVTPFPEMPPTAVTNPPQQAAMTPFGNYALAPADPGAVYFYPTPQDQHAAQGGPVPTAAPAGQFGIYITPTVDDVFLYSHQNMAMPAATNGTGGGNGKVYNDMEMYKDGQEKVAIINTRRHSSSGNQVDAKNTNRATVSSAVTTHFMVSSSSSKTTLSSSYVPTTVNFKSTMGSAYNTKTNEDTEKQSRLIQLEMKKDEIIKRLTSIKKESVPSYKQHSQHLPSFSSQRDDHSYGRLPRSSSDSDQADSLSASIATSVLQDDYPTVNYAAAVLRGRQGSSTSTGYPVGSMDGGWISSAPVTNQASSFAAMSISGNGKRNSSTESTSDYYSHWRSSATSSFSSWAQTRTTTTANGTNSNRQQYGYATRPYIPDEHIDIKHLSDDVLRKELEQLPPSTKRLHYVRLELEAREADAWRSEDDQVIPFSTCGPQVSRYGPISRAGQRVQSSVMTSSSLSSAGGVTPSEGVVHVKDILLQPLPTASVQPSKDQLATRDELDPSQIVSTIPQVFKVTTVQCIDPSTVDEKLEKLVEVKSKLASMPLEDGASSSAEKEQLKVELELINKEISMLDERAGEECLLKALENVNSTIEELQQQHISA